MITGRQIRAARALLDWKAEDLAKKAGLTRVTVSKIESHLVQPQERTAASIIHAFNDHGIEFTADEGVRRRSDSITKLEGFSDFKFFMDLVYEAARQPYSHDGSKPICICNLDNSLFRKYMRDYHAVHVERLRKIKGLAIKSLAASMDKGHIPSATYLVYRYMKEFKATVAPFYVFGDKFSLIDFHVQNPPRILMIDSPSLANSYREQFEILWRSARETPSW